MFTCAGTDNALWAKSMPSGSGPGGWRKIGGTLTDAPAAAGTREPGLRTIVGIIGANHALWTTDGGWSNAFTRAWIPRG